MASSISSTILKNVVGELQKNVTAEMERFQQQIVALDAIIRHSAGLKEERVTPAPSPIILHDNRQFDELYGRINKLADNVDMVNTSFISSLSSITKRIDIMSDSTNVTHTSLAATIADTKQIIVNISEMFMKNEKRHAEDIAELKEDNRMLNQHLQVLSITRTHTSAPPSTPIAEPDIEDTVLHYEEVAEPDIVDVVTEVQNEPEVEKEPVVVAVVKEVEKEEEEEEAEEEEDGEFEEVEYKGNTYYVDSDSIAYTLNEEGELNEDPVGAWVPEKKIIRFYKKST